MDWLGQPQITQDRLKKNNQFCMMAGLHKNVLTIAYI